MITDLVFLGGHSIEEIMDCFDSSIGDWYQAKNIDMIALSKLGEVLEVSDYESLSQGFEMASEPDEQMLFTFPQQLKEKIARLSSHEIERAVEKWVLIQGFQGYMSKEACITYLFEVREFFKNQMRRFICKWAHKN